MCLFVWIGTEQPVPPVEPAQASDPLAGCYMVREAAADEAIRACFALPHVTYVGSHEGCGCGFNSGILEWGGVADAAEAMELIDAMTSEEREVFLAQQRSRARLRELVDAALAHGSVEVYGCWAGDEALAPLRVEAADSSWITACLSPIKERVKYAVRCGGALQSTPSVR